MKKYKVIVWGTGSLGAYALRYLIPNPHYELTGVKTSTESKEGKDAAELCEGNFPATGIKATRNMDAILATDADCVIFVPRVPLSDPTIPGGPTSTWVSDLEALLASGKNVISSILSAAHWRHYKNGEAFKAQIDAACKKGNSTLFVTGIDPGFTPDAIAYALASIVGEVKQINTWEVLDYGPYPTHESLHTLGFGAKPENRPPEALEPIRVAWGGCPHLLADGFGVELEDTRVEGDFYLAEETYTAENGFLIKKGTIAALNFKVIGVVDGHDRFIINHITRMGQHAAPEWRRIGRDGGYAIEIDGHPPFKGEFPFGQPGGTGASWSDALAMTSARCVNSIEAVVQAEPGYKTFLDLSPLGGRYALARL